MPKELNPFNIVGAIITIVLEQIAFSASNFAPGAPAIFVLILNVSALILAAMVGYVLGQVPAFLITQEEVLTTYRVKSFTMKPETRDEKRYVNDEDIQVTFRCTPVFHLEYYVEGEKTASKELRTATILEARTQYTLYKVYTWKFKQPWHRFIQYQNEKREVVVVPIGTKVYDN